MPENTLQHIMNMITEPFAAVDNHFRLTAFNKAYEDKMRLSFNKKAEVGKTFAEIYDDEPEILALTVRNWKVALDGQVHEFEDEFFLSGRLRKNYKVIISPLLNEQQQICGAYCIAREFDVEEQQEKEIEMMIKEDFLREASELAKIGGWEFFIHDQSIRWSEGIYAIYEMEQTLDKPEDYTTFFPSESKTFLEKSMKECIEQGKPFDLELSLITARGNHKTVRIIGKADMESGHVHRVFGVLQDITEQYMMQSQLINNQKLMRSLFDSINIGYCSLDREYNFTYVNKRILERVTDIDFIGNNIYDLFPILKGTDIERFFLDIINQQLTITFEYVLPITNTWCEFTVSPIGDEGTGIFIKDISERKQMEENIRRANEELQSVNEYLSNQNKQLEDFAHIVSHNLRSPIANLNSLVELYYQAETESERETYLTMFSEVVNNATITLNDLIEVIRIKKVIKKDLEKLFFEDVLKRTKEILSADIENSGAIITHDFADINHIEYPKIYLDSIFQNLLSNSIKYRSSTRLLKIHLKAKKSKGRVMLTVEDNGLGMDMHRYGDRLFGFQRTFHKNKNSKGLGLFITKNQIESMGGSITAKSYPDAGMKIIITF